MNIMPRTYTFSHKSSPPLLCSHQISFYLPFIRVPQLITLLNAPETTELLADEGVISFSYLIIPNENTAHDYARAIHALAHRAHRTHSRYLPIASGTYYHVYFDSRTTKLFAREQYAAFPLSVLDDLEDFQREVIPRIAWHASSQSRN